MTRLHLFFKLVVKSKKNYFQEYFHTSKFLIINISINNFDEGEAMIVAMIYTAKNNNSCSRVYQFLNFD